MGTGRLNLSGRRNPALDLRQLLCCIVQTHCISVLGDHLEEYAASDTDDRVGYCCSATAMNGAETNTPSAASPSITPFVGQSLVKPSFGV